MPERARLHMFKTLVSTKLTYPCTPLNACKRSHLARLQVAYNSGLRFVFQKRYPETPTAKSLHEKAGVDPINVILYDRGKKTWDKIEAGIAGDVETCNNIKDTEIRYPHSWFPSSLNRARRDPPPPLYTAKDTSKWVAKVYYSR